MITLKCDVCGDQYKAGGIFTKGVNMIVGNRQHLHGFRELIPQLKSEKVNDACKDCFEKIERKRFEIAQESPNEIFIQLRKWIMAGCND